MSAFRGAVSVHHGSLRRTVRRNLPCPERIARVRLEIAFGKYSVNPRCRFPKKHYLCAKVKTKKLNVDEESVHEFWNKQAQKGDLKSVTNNHRTKISNALVDFAIKYAASHKNTKFIVEGVYLFWMVSPEKLKDCAVYIKGTSSIKSAIRAAKRDGGMQDNTKDKVIVFSKTLAKKFYGMTYNTGNIDRWRKYYQTLQDKEEKSMKEAYIFNKKDIYYNRNKFNNGETNLCFITGQSGSGKSTMGKYMQGRCEVYDLDDVVWNKESFTMDNFKEYNRYFENVKRK